MHRKSTSCLDARPASELYQSPPVVITAVGPHGQHLCCPREKRTTYHADAQSCLDVTYTWKLTTL